MKKRIFAILLTVVLCAGLAVPVFAGGREFAFELRVNYTADYNGYEPYTYSSYILQNYDVEELYQHPDFRAIEQEFIEISNPWLDGINNKIRDAQNILLPRPTPSEWIELDPGFVFLLDDGSTLTMHIWDSSSGVIVSDETVTGYGGEENIPQIVSVVSVPELPGYTIAQMIVSNGTVTIRVNPNEGYTAPDYSGVSIPIAKLDGTTAPVVTPEPPAATVATPTASAVLVNGVNVSFDAYKINDNNYFKLRDLAFILSGTEAQFEVQWNAAMPQDILLTSGVPYTAVGGEMAAKGSGEKTPAVSTAKIYLNGVLVELAAYNIDYNNYFKLRDLGEALDFEVDWDNVNQTIVIDTTKGYTPD